jgi:hypothetical protein
MGPLPSHRMGPSPPFFSTAVDLFGPLSFVDPSNKRKTGKGWGVVFVCTATSLVHVEMTQSYSTDSFLMALRRFMGLHGAPRRFQSDQGDQLVAASKQVGGWDWSKVDEECSRRGSEWDNTGVVWRLVPTGGQHYNGQAERVIGLLKKCLEQSLEGKRCSWEEVGTLLCDAAHIVNSRPIAHGKATEDPLEGGPITPLHLQLGRASIEIPEATYDLQPSLTRRLQYVSEITAEFWKKWMAQVFQGHVLSHKWRKSHRDMKVDDLVLIKNENAAGVEYQRGRVKATFPGEDGHVRSAEIEYKNPSEKVFRTTVRPIQKLVVIVPVDYRHEDDEPGK